MAEERAIGPGSADGEDRRLRLSALMDGELGDGDAARLCTDWRDDAQLRVTWHAYHLIGDVMRSDDLAHAAAHDEAFLRSLRERLAREPVVLAPAATVAPPALAVARRTRRWATSAAVAAGFAAVAGVLVVMRTADPGAGSGGAVLASAPVAPVPVATVPVSADLASVSPATGGDGILIRDARLDSYLEAHKQYGPGVLMVPGGVVRSTAVAAVQR